MDDFFDEFRLISVFPFKMTRLRGKSFFLGGGPPFSLVFMGNRGFRRFFGRKCGFIHGFGGKMEFLHPFKASELDFCSQSRRFDGEMSGFARKIMDFLEKSWLCTKMCDFSGSKKMVRFRPEGVFFLWRLDSLLHAVSESPVECLIPFRRV